MYAVVTCLIMRDKGEIMKRRFRKIVGGFAFWLLETIGYRVSLGPAHKRIWIDFGAQRFYFKDPAN